ncbi:TetR/AcrR family transcriptional regulator [Cohnella thailandensis]|uniref:Helix-turn-helix transcriptional regulator n=1 Tax=Cohnella thailandensis TaxID=557557 RepID=A0A841T2R4_9BACL|nr:TetR/AcrR family transcriptional regulator [Cohnella thailandensis]MBB6637146.1 helix-turn-helix transcriptional regulator [Cohnella thailandensis]MBP1977036.1 AcrR family transcriptional regulator [Cohnella thailandensis]
MITSKDNMCEFAIRLFQEHGYENVSINTICSRLNVTRGSFYHHFNSKNDLLLYWFASQVRRNIALDLSLPSPKQILKKHAVDYANIIRNVGHDFMYHILMAEFELEGKHFHTYLDGEGQSIELIDRALDRREIHSGKPAKELLDTFSSAVIGAIVLWKFEKGSFDIVKKIESIFEVTYR